MPTALVTFQSQRARREPTKIAGPIGTANRRPEVVGVLIHKPIAVSPPDRAISTCPCHRVAQLVHPSRPAVSVATRTSPMPTAGGERNRIAKVIAPIVAAAAAARSSAA